MHNAELRVDGVQQPTVTAATVRSALQTAHEIVEVHVDGRVMQAVAVPGGVQLWQQDATDRRAGHATESATTEAEAVAMLVAFAQGTTTQSPVVMKPVKAHRSTTVRHYAVVPLLAFAALVACAMYGVASYDEAEGEVNLIAVAAGIVSWFVWMYFYLAHTVEWVRIQLAKRLDLVLRPKLHNYGPLFWHVDDSGRWAARVIVAMVSGLLLLGLILPLAAAIAIALAT